MRLAGRSRERKQDFCVSAYLHREHKHAVLSFAICIRDGDTEIYGRLDSLLLV